MSYHTAERGVTTMRTLSPYQLLLRSDDWYVIAHDGFRHEIRVFAVQRFRSVRETGEHFDRPSDFRVEDYLGDSFRMVRGDGHYKVVLQFRPPAARWVAEKRWHASQTMESQPDGGVILRFEVSDLREIARWSLFWGSACTVLEPQELQALIAEECQRILGGSSITEVVSP